MLNKVPFIQLLLAFFMLLPSMVMAQNPSIGKIRDPGDRYDDKCKQYIMVDNRIPIEDNYYISLSNGMLYLNVTDEKYYDMLFKKRNDGFAVDVIRQEQYGCDGPNDLDDSWAHKGTLLPPIFKKQFKKKVIRRDGWVRVPYMQLPKHFDPGAIEFNLVVLQKKWYCGYKQYVGFEEGNWSLLPMGLYRDSIPAHVGSKFEELSKVVSFTIPFAKDQSTFDKRRIKPLYDTLRLTDYVIREIRINTYASVEGSKARNIELQEARAQSIVEALQAYQSEKVVSTVNSMENWDDFYRQVSNTPFSHLATLSKGEIKRSLNNDKALLERLRPLLARHRKADIDIILEKRLTTETDDPEILKQFFAQRVKEKNIEEALFIQQEIFRKIKDQRLPEEFVGELEIPEATRYAPLLNNDLIFKREYNLSAVEKSLEDFIKLSQLVPDRPKIQYNIVALKIRLWVKTRRISYVRDAESRLKLLEESDLPEYAVARLAMNYDILRANYYHARKNYKKKNAVVDNIYNKYRQTHLTDQERMSLAMYLSHYYRFGYARAVLKPRVRQADVPDDILFYYLGLMLANPDGVLGDELARTLYLAQQRSMLRFCELFKPISKGGITFQLLEDPSLKSLYCEVCSAGS